METTPALLTSPSSFAAFSTYPHKSNLEYLISVMPTLLKTKKKKKKPRLVLVILPSCLQPEADSLFSWSSSAVLHQQQLAALIITVTCIAYSSLSFLFLFFLSFLLVGLLMLLYWGALYMCVCEYIWFVVWKTIYGMLND